MSQPQKTFIMKSLQELTRPNIWNLKPYSSARDEYKGHDASIFLDANENPYNSPNNRYPDPTQHKVKTMIAKVKGTNLDNIFLGNGSDEAIDLLFRAFCRTGVDNVVAISPTYGMYEVCADINDIEYRKVLLGDKFQFDASKLLSQADENTKLAFLCSPNNPTGNSLPASEIEKLIDNFQGLVILDEAYIDFSSNPSFLDKLNRYPNLVILQTFSKAWGSAAIRLGMAFASPEIIQILNKVKYPYNVNLLTQKEAIRLLEEDYKVKEWVETLLNERTRLMEEFSQLPCCMKVYPTDANFFLARVTDAKVLYEYLVKKGIIVRNRSSVVLCKNCLRITIGTRHENEQLVEELRKYEV